MKTFSRPEISGWKPAPSSMSAATRPATTIRPLVGLSMPATSLSIVDLPEPLPPMRPNASPRPTVKSMPSRAAMASSGRSPLVRLRPTSALLRVRSRSPGIVRR
jgi:hypothetical protein